MLLSGAAAVLAVAGYLFYLDRLVTRQFEGRRWTLPAQVYAAPLELYAGAPFTAPLFEAEWKSSAAVFLPGGKVPGPGTLLARPALGEKAGCDPARGEG